MPNNDFNPPKTTVNVDKLAIVNDARKIIDVVLNLAIEANRGLTAGECEILAAVTRLIDESADACLTISMKTPVSFPPTNHPRQNERS